MTITYSSLAFLPVICSETRENVAKSITGHFQKIMLRIKIGTDNGGGLFFFVTSPFKFSAYTK